jgi:hypothetical protein
MGSLAKINDSFSRIQFMEVNRKHWKTKKTIEYVNSYIFCEFVHEQLHAPATIHILISFVFLIPLH